jgi:hypothetical protein
VNEDLETSDIGRQLPHGWWIAPGVLLGVVLIICSLLWWGHAKADVSTTETPGTWTLKKGTSNVQTGIASYEACRAVAQSKATTTATKYTCNVANILTVKVANGTATITWVPPTTNTDGSALTDLAGYAIYYGTNSTALTQEVSIPSPGLTTFIVSNLAPGTYYFAMTAVNSSSIESDQSGIASKALQ